MDKHDKVFAGMEKLANTEGYSLTVNTSRDAAGNWIIMFTAGPAQVYCRLSSFVRAPQIVLEPFCDELVRLMK
jgi:hypothetical protein